MELTAVSVHRVVVLWMQTSAFLYRLIVDRCVILTFFFFNLMNEDQAGPAHLQILRCYLMSQAPESPGGPLSSAGRVALTRPSERTVADSEDSGS